MTNNKRQFEVRRNNQVCSGSTACGKCEKYLPKIAINGSVPVDDNEFDIDLAILHCPVGALEIKEI